jgi:hypothetical protein
VRFSKALIACALLAAPACSNDDEGTPSSGTGGQTHGDASNSSGAVAPELLALFCQTLAGFFCDRCLAADPTCSAELETACAKNAVARDPGGYTKNKGQACLDALAEVDCKAPPRNCQGNLALAECNAYLDGRTNGVDPECP